jgi:hypothetical protein
VKVVSRVDAAGLYMEDVVLTDSAALPPDHVEDRPSPGFHRPKWSGSEWVEGMAASEILASAKAAKRSELASAFVEACTNLYPEVDPTYAIWLAVPEYVENPRGTRPQAIKANIARLQDRLGKVNAATTVAEVGVIVW